MPIYPFTCKCGNKFEKCASIKVAPKTAQCSCGRQAKRDYSAYGGFNAVMKDNPRWSWAMGAANSQEVAERTKEHPDRVYDSDGRLLIRNRQHKKLEMKRHGLDEKS